MIKLAFYGKGGIGKSTTVSNLAAAMAQQGLRVMQVGCDPKADSTIALRRGQALPTVLELVRQGSFALEDMVREGFAGVVCVEAGGPTPGVVLYDVLGDVVCGGFSMPMRKGYADEVFILTSGENMALHAAANIAMALDHFKDRGYARLGGLILNRRDVPREEEKVAELAEDLHSTIIGSLHRSETVQEAEELGKTVLEAFPDSAMAEEYRALARQVLRQAGGEQVC